MRERIAAEVRRVRVGRQSRLKDESCGNSVIRFTGACFLAYLGLGGMLVWFDN